MTFTEWLKDNGCQVIETQADDGSGYACYYVTLPNQIAYDITVNTG